jgi:hypothetical protein
MLDGSSPVPDFSRDPLAPEEEKIDFSVFDDNPTASMHVLAVDEPVMTPLQEEEEKDFYNDNEPLNTSKEHQENGFLGLDVTRLLSVLTSNNGGSGNESKTEDPLLAFLELQRDSLKCTPQESFDWLRNQDIMTLGDLREACLDDEFLELEFKTKGGLKGFKRRPFVKSVVSAASSGN